MTDAELRARLSNADNRASLISSDTTSAISPVDLVRESSIRVMASYQNANKWLDTIKEELLMEYASVFFSNYIHELAHKMPVQFDKFGDILHTGDIKIVYPATEYIPYSLSDIESIFSAINEILYDINVKLRDFIKCTQDTNYHSMANAAEELLSNIDGENTHLYRMMKAYKACNSNIIAFDKWVAHYTQNMTNLLG